MANSPILFTLFYNKIRADIVLFLNTNPFKQEYETFIHTIAYNVFEERFNGTVLESVLVTSLQNNLTVYLEIVRFIKEYQKPFMPGNMDMTNVRSILNRFYYLYALVLMKDQCEFSSAIPTIITTYLN
jgi:hypothetical protein